MTLGHACSIKIGSMQKKPEGAIERMKSSLAKAAIMTVVVAACFLLMLFTLNGFLVTCIAASAFIAFAFPHAESARIKYLLGGYVIGLAMGLLGHIVYFNLLLPTAADEVVLLIACCMFSVFMSAFLMLFLEMQHPPAAALAASVVVDESPYMAAVIALACILFISLIRYLVDKYYYKKEAKENKAE